MLPQKNNPEKKSKKRKAKECAGHKGSMKSKKWAFKLKIIKILTQRTTSALFVLKSLKTVDLANNGSNATFVHVGHMTIVLPVSLFMCVIIVKVTEF